MKLRLFAIYDRKMNIYLTPFPARGEVDAIRNIQGSFASNEIKQTPIGTNPADFDLIEVGYFDDETGEIGKSMPIIVGNIKTIVDISTPSTVLS